MKKARVLLSALMLSAIGLTTLTVTSCNKDDKKCNVGYEGKDCKTLSRDKFIGTWNGLENCTLGTDNYTVSVTASGTSEVQIVIGNVYNQGFIATGSITGEQTMSFNGSEGDITYSGTGKINTANGDLELTYNISNAGTTNSCTFIGGKL